MSALADVAATPAIRAQGRRSVASQSLGRRALRTFLHDRVAMTALFVVTLVVLFVVFAGQVSQWTGFTPYENDLPNKLSQPGENGYRLGSDANGRDILTRLAYGGRSSLTVALLATFVELTIGLGIGLLAGYLGGWVDALLMRLVDVLLSIPTLPLLILVSTLYSPGKYALALIFALIFWPGE
jgi:peptide/nickel transport system permease protein